MPRKLSLPIVIAVAAITLALSGYTFVFISWFGGFYDAYVENNGAVPVQAMVAYRHYYWLMIPLGLAVLGVGGRLACAAETRADFLVWYVSASVTLLVIWFLLTLAVERTVFVEYGLPA